MTSISIIIPALDEARVLPGLLADLQVLRRAGHEVIVVDGGSRDGTAAQARPWVDHVLTSPRGRARQMNCGAEQARGAWLWFVHADCRVPIAATAALRAATTADAGRWGRFDVRLSGRAALLRWVERLMNWRSRWSGIVTGDQGLFVRAELFRRVGGFPDIPLMEDIAVSKRLKRHGRPLRVTTPLLSSSRRWERDGVWRTIFLMWRLRAAYALGADPAVLARRYYGASAR